MSTSDPTASPTTFDLEHRVDSVDTTLQNPRTAVVALGSNLGNRLETLQGAVDALADTPGLRITAVSAVFETAALGGPGEQPNYYNAVVVLRTTLPPYSLLERANAIEDAFGRERTVRWGARTLDVDIITYEGMLSSDRCCCCRTRAPTSASSCSGRGTTRTGTASCPATARSPTCWPRSAARAPRACSVAPTSSCDCRSKRNRAAAGCRCGCGYGGLALPAPPAVGKDPEVQ